MEGTSFGAEPQGPTGPNVEEQAWLAPKAYPPALVPAHLRYRLGLNHMADWTDAEKARLRGRRTGPQAEQVQQRGRGWPPGWNHVRRARGSAR